MHNNLTPVQRRKRQIEFPHKASLTHPFDNEQDFAIAEDH